MNSAGIFGPKLSGKTTLAKVLAENYWTKQQLQTLCLDINGETWPKSVWATSNEDEFWQRVWQTKGQLVIVDEASSTIKRDKELIPVFTRLRHLNHKLIIIGHNGMNLLPIMREQFDTLYLFRQPEKASAIWAETFTDKRLLQASELKQYEFLFCQLYQTPKRQILKIETVQKV
jgi:hypothetical protein